jgi:hypothetical protein
MKSKDNRLIILIILTIILIVGGIITGLIVYSQEKNQLDSKIEVIPQKYDIGVISMADGPVKYVYKIKNIGEGDLQIKGIETSCMCTTATLRVGNKESPEFGMHNNLSFWSQRIKPKETGYLEVVFDPAFHGSGGTGDVVRAVYISSNDPQGKKTEVRLIANVVK